MDISFLAKDFRTGIYTWAGANNPLWILSQGKITEVTADKQPIGFSEHSQHFTTQRLKVKEGDLIVLFTDGYADQFGGPKGKKFKYQQLANFLEQHDDLSPEQLKKKLIA